MDTTSPHVSYAKFFERACTYQIETGGLYIPFYDYLEKLFDNAIGADEAATRVSSFIFSHGDSVTIYAGVISSIIGAGCHLSETRDLEKVANLLLALSRLPDVRNESSHTLHLSFNLKDYEIPPGQAIKVDDGMIWSDLPGFATDLGDCMRGPTAYINDGTPEHIAEQQWTNQNTFAAYLIRRSDNSPCNFDYLYQYAFRVLADSLEWDARTVEGMNSLHSLQAAMRWLLIAGNEVWEKTRTSGGWAVAGPLWLEDMYEEDDDEEESKNYNLVTPARWSWWAVRLNELAQSNMIDEESKSMAKLSANNIRGLGEH
ncbi:hypothetical protein E4T44_00758 [Aureobasidium sp. EXF-8845]|nr:hypothetical protein E4T44_00758 [Aureobasidium sp. EXF-8845]KAI4857827.1 hypothetical protein E4T45_00667 [Aureobasidium sp. EXF-8846]